MPTTLDEKFNRAKSDCFVFVCACITCHGTTDFHSLEVHLVNYCITISKSVILIYGTYMLN